MISKHRLARVAITAILLVLLFYFKSFQVALKTGNLTPYVNGSSTTVTSKRSSDDAKTEHMKINSKQTQTYFKSRKRSYGNKADFAAIKRIFDYVQSLNLCTRESIVLVGGTNDGQLSKTLLTWCPNITFYGFEIQQNHFRTASRELSIFPKAAVINMGWSELEMKDVPIGGAGETGGLFDPEGQFGWALQDKTVNTIPLSEFANRGAIDQILYLVIDTEGHEPKVIRGMQLNETKNQERFPLFQYELGGTWAARDKRHGNDTWSQQKTAEALEDWGYSLFMVGDENWLAINAHFFEEENNPAMEYGGLGPFVQGNVMAMHPKFIHTELKELILGKVHYETQTH